MHVYLQCAHHQQPGKVHAYFQCVGHQLNGKLNTCLQSPCLSSMCRLPKKWAKPISFHLISLLTVRVIWAPQMISQPVSSIFPCSPLPSGTCRTPGLSIPWCCLPTSSSVCFVFFPLSKCLARWFWPDAMNRRHNHTTAVSTLYDGQDVFVWSNCLLDLGIDFFVGNTVLVWDT